MEKRDSFFLKEKFSLFFNTIFRFLKKERKKILETNSLEKNLCSKNTFSSKDFFFFFFIVF